MQYGHHDQVLDTLQRSRELLNDHWGQGYYTKNRTIEKRQGIWPMGKMQVIGTTATHCLIGGVKHSICDFLKAGDGCDWRFRMEVEIDVRCALAVAIRETGFISPFSVEAWNDQKERTHAEVMAVIDRAIDLVRLDMPIKMLPLKVIDPAHEFAQTA